MTQKIIFSDIQKADIVQKYLSDKMTIESISLNYGLSVSPIKSVLRELNVITRDPSETSRKHSLDEHYFDCIDSYDKAYFLGLLFADGYNSDHSIVLSLSKKDIRILEIFRCFIKSQQPLKFSVSDDGRFEYCGLSLYSSYLSKKLTELGCMKAKSLKIKFPEEYLKGDLIRHFIRGYFDGDGCISCSYSPKDNPFGNVFSSVITFTSTEDFCLYLKKYFKDNFDIHSTMLCRHPSHHNNNRTLQISGNKQVEEIMKWMYYDTDLYLQRKYDKFLNICKIREERNIIVSKRRSENGRKVMDGVNKMIKDKKEYGTHS